MGKMITMTKGRNAGKFIILPVMMVLMMVKVGFGQTQIVLEHFSSSDPAGWTKDAAPTWNLTYNGGSAYGGSGYAASIANGSTNKYFYVPITLKQNYKYDVDFYCKNLKDIKVVINETADLTTPLNIYTQLDVANGSTSYKHVDVTQYTHLNTTTSGYLMICVTSANYGTSTGYLDDLRIIETPPTCSYPITQATIGTFSNTGSDRTTVNWTRGDGDGVLVVGKKGSAPTNPTDGSDPTANSIFGLGSDLGSGSFVVYKGSNNTIEVTNLDPSAAYYFTIYEYTSSGPCYKVAGSGSNSTTNRATKYYINDASNVDDTFCTALGNASNNGSRANVPKLSLKSLLATYTLQSGDTVFIDAGTYNNEENINFYTSGVTFQGAGAETTIFDDNSAGTATNYFMYIDANNVTIRDITIREYENNGTYTPPGHSGQAITINSSSNVLLENIITLYNGQSGGNPSISVLSNSSVTIRGGGGLCNVWQTQYTGGVEAWGTNINLSIEDYVIVYNFKDGSYDGGGLLIANGNATTVVNVDNTRFYNNDAAHGGAIAQRCGLLTVTNCIIDHNFAGQSSTPVAGGGVRITGGTATFSDTKFINNGKSGDAGSTLRGGAIGVISTDGNVDLTLNNCYFSGNSAESGDDIYAAVDWSNTVNIHATNTTFSSTADAIFNIDATHIHLKDCGNPSVSGSNSPAVYFENTGVPSSTPNPTAPNFTGDCSLGITLPVELTGFYGMCSEDKTELYWQTASETNNHYFIVEKSVNGIDFYPVGTIDGSGNSNQLINYQFSDNEPAAEGAYYRLVQVDFDGATASFDPIFVSNECNNTGVEITSSYYNPDTHLLEIEIVASNAGISRLTLTDYLGRIMFAEVLNLEEGINHFSMAIPEINPSVCLLILQHSNVQQTCKVPVF